MTTQDKIFFKSVYTTVDSHIIWLCGNVFCHYDLSLCSFLEYVSNETNLNIKKNPNLKGVTKISTSDQTKEKIGLNIKEGVILMMKLTRGSVKFNE